MPRVMIDGVEYLPRREAIPEQPVVEALKTTLDVLKYLEVRTASGNTLDNIQIAIRQGEEALATKS